MPTSARAGSVDSMGWLNGEMLCFHPISLPHSTRRGGFVRLRADVGIGPYIRIGVRIVHQAFDLSKCIRGGRQPTLGFILT